MKQSYHYFIRFIVTFFFRENKLKDSTTYDEYIIFNKIMISKIQRISKIIEKIYRIIINWY